MKTEKYLIALLAILTMGSLQAQRMQVKLQVGYGVPLMNTPQWTLLSNNKYSIQSFSFGSGLRIEGGLIKQLTKNLSVQLDAAYLAGKKNPLPQDNGTDYLNITYYAKFYDVSPLIRFTVEESKIKPYVAVGPIFGFGKLYRDTENGTFGSTNTATSTREYRGSFAFGAKSELGVQLKRGKFSYYAQLTVIAMRYSPTASELTAYVVNASSQLASLTVSQRQSVYSNSISATSTNDPNQPTQALKSSYVFDNASLSLGVMFALQ